MLHIIVVATVSLSIEPCRLCDQDNHSYTASGRVPANREPQPDEKSPYASASDVYVKSADINPETSY
jgi:hypothetical protein